MNTIRTMIRIVLQEEEFNASIGQEIKQKVFASDGGDDAFKRIYTEYVIERPDGKNNTYNVINEFQKISLVAKSIMSTEPFKSNFINNWGQYSYDVMMSYLNSGKISSTQKEKLP